MARKLKKVRVMTSIDELRVALNNCRKLRERTTSKLLPIGLITSFLEPEGVIPLIYGGLAVEYYLSGSHNAGDIDLYCTNPERLAELLCQVGCVSRDTEVFEHPGVPVKIQLRTDMVGKISERYTKVPIRGYHVYMLTIEQSILDYVHKFIESDDPNLEVVFAADMVERCNDRSLKRLVQKTRQTYGDKEHIHVLRAIIALRAQKIFSP